MAIILKAILAICVVFFSRLAWKALNWVWFKPKKMEKHLKEQGLQGPSYKFLFGNVKELHISTNEAKSKPMKFSHHILPRVMPFMQSLIEKYGTVTYIWLGATPRVIVTDPDMLRDIFSEKFASFRKSTSNPLGRLLVTGIVRLEGEKWAKHRKIINPAFHLEKLKLMLPAFYISCSEMVDKWQTAVGEGSAELDVYPFMKKLTADVISRTAFGSSYEDGLKIFELQTEQANLIMQASQSINIPGFLYLPTKRNKRMKEIQREVRTLLRDMITKREKAMEDGKVHNNDLLGLLMESNLQEIKDGGNSKNFGITMDEVIEECKLFYFAGQDTTMNLLNWTMILLSVHQDWQEIARKEVLQVFGGNKPDFDGLKHLKQITMILNEVLRLYPPISYLTRATCEKVKLGEVVLPEGTEIIIPTLSIHHDRKLWGEDAEEFKPERFAEGIAKATNNKVAFIPLGWGPRVCIGQNFTFIEAKMAIAMIVQKFSFELSSTYVHAPYTVITLQPQHGTQIVLHKL